jgi:hypothetical protein
MMVEMQAGDTKAILDTKDIVTALLIIGTDTISLMW